MRAVDKKVGPGSGEAEQKNKMERQPSVIRGQNPMSVWGGGEISETPNWCLDLETTCVLTEKKMGEAGWAWASRKNCFFRMGMMTWWRTGVMRTNPHSDGGNKQRCSGQQKKQAAGKIIHSWESINPKCLIAKHRGIQLWFYARGDPHWTGKHNISGAEKHRITDLILEISTERFCCTGVLGLQGSGKKEEPKSGQTMPWMRPEENGGNKKSPMSGRQIW